MKNHVCHSLKGLFTICSQNWSQFTVSPGVCVRCSSLYELQSPSFHRVSCEQFELPWKQKFEVALKWKMSQFDFCLQVAAQMILELTILLCSWFCWDGQKRNSLKTEWLSDSLLSLRANRHRTQRRNSVLTDIISLHLLWWVWCEIQNSRWCFWPMRMQDSSTAGSWLGDLLVTECCVTCWRINRMLCDLLVD
jgi:hypothetical protein